MWIRSLLIALCATGAVACGQGSGLITQAHGTMGSEVRVTMRALDRAVADESFAAVFAEFDRLESLMSVCAGSDVVRLNAAAGDHPVAVAPKPARCSTPRTSKRLDFRQVRHHVRRADRCLEVRSRPGRSRPDTGRDSLRGCRSSTTAR